MDSVTEKALDKVEDLLDKANLIIERADDNIAEGDISYAKLGYIRALCVQQKVTNTLLIGILSELHNASKTN